MTDKELRHMNRANLIEIIYQYEKKVEDLATENARLSNELQERRIKIEKAGSVAEAALSLNRVFEAAQQAADQYLYEIQSANDGAEAQAQQILAEAQQKSDALIEQGQKQYSEMIQRGEREYTEKIKLAEDECEAIRGKIQEFIRPARDLVQCLAEVPRKE